MALINRDIIILGHAKFDSPFESTGFTIARYLAKNNRVFYAEHPFTWKDYFKFRKKKEGIIRRPFFKSSSTGVLETETPGLKIVITPPVFSINFLPEGALYRRLLRMKERVVVKRLQTVISTYNCREVIYINIFNFHFPGIARSLHPVLTVYYCVDPMIVPYDMKHGITSENLLVKKSDLVISTSRQLYEEKKVQNKHTFFIPNAADLAHSRKALDEHLAVHPLISGLQKPIAGYFGNIERRIDFELLKQLFERCPDISFVLAGPVSETFLPGWITNYKNVYLTGRIPYDEMPQMVKGFDVALIPFRKDAVSRTIFPLKLFEYLGAGKPVVCTDFNPDLHDFTGDTVAYCNGAEECMAAIRKALIPDQLMREKGIAIAANNTWDVRIEEISAIISRFLTPDAKGN